MKHVIDMSLTVNVAFETEMDGLRIILDAEEEPGLLSKKKICFC